MKVRLSRLVISWILVGVGVPLLLRAELGVSPVDVLNTGVHHISGWSFGVCFIVTSLSMFTLGRLLGARLGWACLAGTVVIGPMINVVLDRMPTPHSLLLRSCFLLGGILVIAVAICLVVSTELGPGPAEVVMLGLVRRGMPIVPARWISDGTPVVVGAAMGGQLGVGTVVFAVVMGPLVKFGLRRLGYAPRPAPIDAPAVDAADVTAADVGSPSSTSNPSTRRSISSRIGRTASTP